MGVVTKDSSMFVTHRPCVYCLKLCINAGVREMFYSIEYDDEYSRILEVQASDMIKIYRIPHEIRTTEKLV